MKRTFITASIICALMLIDISLFNNHKDVDMSESLTVTTSCTNSKTISFGVNSALASHTDPEDCDEDCDSSLPVVCYSIYDNCGWFGSCSTFWRCNPNGDCYSVPGNNERDSGTCS